MKTIVILLVMFLTGCFSSGYEVKKIESPIEVKGQVGERTLGLNDKKEIILQEESNAADELMVQKMVNLRLSDDYHYESHQLKSCRTYLSDPRLGGTGEIPPIVEVDNLKSTETVREEIGITESGELRVVKKSFFVEALKLERKYDESLRKMTKVVKRQKDECEYKLGIARVKAGLPSKRYEGKGYFQNGEWVQTSPQEHSLDDAFEIQAKAKAKARAKENGGEE